MRKILKNVAFTLAFLSVLLPLTACNNSNKSDQTQGDITSTDTVKKEKPNLLPEGSWYDGYVMQVLVSGFDVVNDFADDATASSSVGKAEYRRVKGIREKYGVDIETEVKTNSVGAQHHGAGYIQLEKCYASNTKTYSFASIGMYDAASAAREGYLSNLNSDSFSHIDLSKPWWDQNSNRTFIIDGKLFFATGDISLSEDKSTYCVMFNKFNQIYGNINDPYEMLRENNWTLDNFKSEVKRASSNDACGMEAADTAITAAFVSADNRFAATDEDGRVTLCVYTPRSVSTITKYMELLFTCNVTSDTAKGIFKNGGAAYSITILENAQRYLDEDLKIGYMPMPKYSSDQENYRNLVSPYTAQLVCVPYYVTDKTLIGGILEELAYEGSNSITSLYKESLLGKNASDADKNALDTVLSSTAYDIGLSIKVGGLSTAMATMASTRKDTFTDLYSGMRSSSEMEIKTLNESYNNIIKSLRYQ